MGIKFPMDIESEMVKYANTNIVEGASLEDVTAMKEAILKLSDVLGIVAVKKEEVLDSDIEALIAERQAARKSKDFARADEIRNKLSEMGIILEDTREGVKWKRA